MNIVNNFKGLTGKQLIDKLGNNSSMVEIGGEIVSLVPVTMSFSNQAEISNKDDATHLSARTRFMDHSLFVII